MSTFHTVSDKLIRSGLYDGADELLLMENTKALKARLLIPTDIQLLKIQTAVIDVFGVLIPTAALKEMIELYGFLKAPMLGEDSPEEERNHAVKDLICLFFFRASYPCKLLDVSADELPRFINGIRRQAKAMGYTVYGCSL